MTKNYSNISPGMRIYDFFERLPYSYWTAFAEFIDNSTQSFLDNLDKLPGKKLKIEINYVKGQDDDSNSDYIEIIDNAYGMDRETFEKSLHLFYETKVDKGRNEFGLGLKSAATWFGKFWYIESTQFDNPIKYKATFDIQNIIQNNVTENEFLEESIDKESHFTKITIRNLNKKIKTDKTHKKIINFLSSMYRLDIKHNNISIYYNGKELSFENPKILINKEDNKEYKKDINLIIHINEKKLTARGFVAIMDGGSRSKSGFAIFRNNRLIIGDKLQYEKPKIIFSDPSSRRNLFIYGEIHLDGWPISQAKDKIDWSIEDLEETFWERFKLKCSDYLKIADKREKMKEKALSDNIIKNSTIFYSKSIELKNHLNKNSSFENENVKNSTEDSAIHTEEQNLFSNNEKTEKNKNPQTIDQNFEFKIYDEKVINFKVLLRNLENNKNWMIIENLTNPSKPFEIIVNKNHSFFYKYKNNEESMELISKFLASFMTAEYKQREKYKNNVTLEEEFIAYLRTRLNQIIERWTD